MNVKFYDIIWDTDGDDVGLPSVVEVCLPSGFDMSEGADFLSDEYEYCVIGYNYEVLE